MSTLVLRTVARMTDVPEAAWNALANPDPAQANPFVSHAFLSILEESGCVGGGTGWSPSHLLLEDDGALVAAAPCYGKSHSMGEYVFDHGWADALARAGGSYYPKLQIAVPFTPVPGPRLLAASAAHRRAMLDGIRQLTTQTGASSAHITFMPEADWENPPAGWLQRQDIQFHWQNAGYGSFEAFLANLSSAKRKNIRKERKAVADAGITFAQLTGDELAPRHWDAFFRFYMDTGSRKWGRPYLNRRFFALLHERLRQHVVLVLAMRAGSIIAGALNLVGGRRLFGRNWGCSEDHPFLHFETCYYQAIDYAIRNRIQVVEAGAQGEHKLARGYVPVKTFSLHHLAHPGLERAVENYLRQERDAIDGEQRLLAAHTPFRHEEQE